MPKYFYTAKSIKGESKNGSQEAKNEHELARILHQEGYILISASLEEKKIKARKFKMDIFSIMGPSLTEKVMFTRNLNVMISAGISLPRALKILSSQTKNKKFEKALLNIRERIIKGENFSSGLEKYPDIFPEIYYNMVKVAEESGTLEEVLRTLSQHMEREHELKSKIAGAMVYPAVIISAMTGIGILMMIMVVPQLADTFEELGIELPPTTKLIIFIGVFLADFWYLIPLIIFAFLFSFRLVLKTKIGKRAFDKLTLKIPIVSSIVKKNNSASTVRTLSSLITSGVPIVRSLEITSGTLGNVYFKEAISEAAKKVKKGEKLSEVLAPYQNIYSPLVVQMIEVGEETGQTADILQKLAEFFEEEVANATKNLSTVIEPVLMLIIGAAIGFFAISMIQPMYSMLDAI